MAFWMMHVVFAGVFLALVAIIWKIAKELGGSGSLPARRAQRGGERRHREGGVGHRRFGKMDSSRRTLPETPPSLPDDGEIAQRAAARVERIRNLAKNPAG